MTHDHAPDLDHGPTGSRQTTRSTTDLTPSLPFRSPPEAARTGTPRTTANRKTANDQHPRRPHPVTALSVSTPSSPKPERPCHLGPRAGCPSRTVGGLSSSLLWGQHPQQPEA